jgi:hypothetical protein
MHGMFLSSKSYETVIPVNINKYSILFNFRGFRGWCFVIKLSEILDKVYRIYLKLHIDSEN